MKPSEEAGMTISDVLHEVCGIWSWKFTYEFELEYSNCMSPNLFSRILLEDKHMDVLSVSAPGDAPLILSNNMGLMFSAVFGESDIWFLGPVYTVEVNEREIEKLLVSYNLTYKTTLALIDNLRQVPNISSPNMFEKTLILHHLVNGVTLSVSDLRMHVAEAGQIRVGSDFRDKHFAAHVTEQKILDCVRYGDLNFREVISHAALVSPGIHMQNGDPITQARYTVLSFITLCSREAIKGGLPADTAYMLADTYSSALHTCRTISELTALSHTMFEDFITRVHRIRTTSGMSRGVRIALEYIDAHIGEDIKLSELAGMAGYTPYYLSRKFKKETGLSPASYIQKQKLERARTLLETSRMSVQEISDALRFCSRSYFSEVFSKEYGVSPGSWRESVLNL